MSTVPPPTAPPTPPAQAQAQAPAPILALIASVPTPPPPLLAMPPGARLEAIVLSADPALSNALVQTALGLFELKAPLPLPADARLILQMALQAPTVQLLILSVNGQPPAGAIRPGAAATPGLTPAASPAESVADRIQVGTVIEATLLRSTPQFLTRTIGLATLSSSLFPLSDQTTLSTRIAHFSSMVGEKLTALPEKVSSALSWLTSSRAPQDPATVPSSRPPAEGEIALPTRGGASSGPIEPHALLPAGTTVAMRVNALRVETPGAPAPTKAAGLALGQSLAATVISSTPGNTIVETEAGPILLATAEALPKGLRLTLEPAGAPRPPLAGTDGQASPLASRGWPALEDAVTLLKRDAPELHRALIATQLARLDSTLAASILTFLTALKTGEITAWLGEDMVRTLGRNRPSLLRRLSDDFREFARVADDPGAGDWRVAVVPFNAQTSVDQLRILTRRGGREDSEGPSESTRFVVDVTLSKLGRVQIDGLVRRKEKRLDLVVRTSEPLPATMREDIRRLFSAAAGATGIVGLVTFDARANGFVEVQAECLLRGSGAIVA